MKLSYAITLAAKAHENQLDLAGDPYILHPIRVMQNPIITTETDKVVAVLHDICEDVMPLHQLVNLHGLSEELIRPIDNISRRPGETWSDFCSRIIQHPTSLKVKIADLEDNMNILRFVNRALKKPDLSRLFKYHQLWLRLRELYTNA